MIRLTTLLVAVMAIVAMTTGEKTSQPTTETATVAEATQASEPVQQPVETLAPPPAQPPQLTETLGVAHAEGVTIREYARSDSPTYLRKMVNMGSSDAPAEARIHQAAASGATTSQVFQVSGNVVNLRSGPSTSNSVVASLTRGTEVEVLAHHGSWAELVVLDSSEIGYMSASFLQAAN
ncbi:SH3 domain-containing protein [Halocynthiibacter styelae]|uniref:SH3 domain-containing protein n=1 Tax=Halocynthiibacter styelae TaxID=2761955 RepID=A0A8J7LP19_9RHOB|nr:SH3 domain-containing protein [Paenihalocynthiibacter styelae]MBI1492941.1 SH3 domain-containing protein [Paenihalocynthiibacter styelae]